MDDWGQHISDKIKRKAKKILESDIINLDLDEEQLQKKLMIIALCLKYNFKYQFVNEFVFIYSIIDEWYFSYMKNTITLLHKNKLYTTKHYHVQKKFKNIVHVLQYIKKHDNFCYKPNYNSKWNKLNQNRKA